MLLNNLGSKDSLVTKLNQFISYYNRKNLIKKSAKNVAWELVPGPFVFIKN